jgi:septal ring factor EnvC (AmiA/AmiB activator)
MKDLQGIHILALMYSPRSGSPLDEVQGLLNNEALHREEIENLQRELSAFKRAYGDVDNERQQLQLCKEEAKKEINMLKSQMKVSVLSMKPHSPNLWLLVGLSHRHPS